MCFGDVLMCAAAEVGDMGGGGDDDDAIGRSEMLVEAPPTPPAMPAPPAPPAPPAMPASAATTPAEAAVDTTSRGGVSAVEVLEAVVVLGWLEGEGKRNVPTEAGELRNTGIRVSGRGREVAEKGVGLVRGVIVDAEVA